MKKITIYIDGNDIEVNRSEDLTDAEFSGVLGMVLQDHSVKMNVKSSWSWVSDMIEKEVNRQTQKAKDDANE